jgi:hypothetical protein
MHVCCGAALQELAGIIAANSQPAQQLAALFQPYLPLLALQQDEHAQRFAEAAGGAATPDLQQFAAEVARLRRAAAEAQALCADAVRTGAPRGCGVLLPHRQLRVLSPTPTDGCRCRSPRRCRTMGRAPARAGLHLVLTHRIKAQLASASEAAVHELLELVCGAARGSNQRVTDEFAVRAVRMVERATRAMCLRGSVATRAMCTAHARHAHPRARTCRP